MAPAFAASAALPGARTYRSTAVCRARAARTARVPRACAPDAPDEKASSADATRAALSAEPPLVKFRRGVDSRTEEDVAFEFTAGNSGGVDVWLVSGVLVLVLPFVLFAAGVATGYIDPTPR